MTNNVTPNVETQASDLEKIPPQSDAERKQLGDASQPWSDSRALEIAKKDFQSAFTYRVNNYDKSFKKCDDVYMALTRVKTWEGTKVPRASIPYWMGVQQIESLLPLAMDALFADDYPFDVLPKVGTTLAQAVQIREVLRDQMENLNPDIIGMTLRELTRRAYKSDLIYGAAPVEFGWLMKQLKRIRYERELVPDMQMVPHPITGMPTPVPNGTFTPRVIRQPQTYSVSRPKIQNVSVWDFVIDQNCPSHNPQEAQFAAVRQLIPIAELKAMCLPEFGFKLPSSDAAWSELADKSKQSMAEVGKGWSEQDRGNYYHAGLDSSSDPLQKRVEVVRYWQKDRHVWLFGREHLAYNEANELGIIPFLNPFYVDVPGRFYGLSLCDLIEGDMKLGQAIIEARIDELNLLIHPPIIRKLGVKVAASQRRLRPGVEWEAEDPTKDIQRMEMGNVTQSAYIETQALEQRVQKTTGVSDLAAMGAPSTGGNSANRTATGINTQAAATGHRVGYQVGNIEDQFLGPLCLVMFLLNKKFTDPNSPIMLPSNDGGKQIDPLDILNSDVAFKFKASDKLRLRRALAGGGLAEVLQFLQASMQGLEMEGIKINWRTIGQIIADSCGLPANDVFAVMTPQEQQQRQQMRMMPEMLKRQMQADRLQSQQAISESKDETQVLIAVVKALISGDTAAAATILNEMGVQVPLDMKKKELEAKNKPKPSGDK